MREPNFVKSRLRVVQILLFKIVNQTLQAQNCQFNSDLCLFDNCDVSVFQKLGEQDLNK